MSLGEAAVDVVSDTSKFEGGLKKSVTAVGKAAIGVAAGVGAIGAAAVGGAFKVATLADEIDKGSQRAGLAASTYQELSYWAGQNGVSTEQMEKAVGRLNLTLGDAVGGNTAAQKAFENLGISITDANGNLRSTDDVTKEAINALAGLEDPALRASAAADLFGMRQASVLLPALSETALTLADASDEAERLSLIMGDDAVKAGVVFGDTWDRIKQGVGSTLRDALTPLMVFMADTVFPFIEDKAVPAIRNLWQVFEAGDGIVDGLLNVFGRLTGGGGVGSIFEKVREVVQNVFSGIVDWLATGGITQILNTLMQARQRLFDAALQLFPAILDALVTFLPQLLGFISGQLIPQLLNFLLTGVPLLLETAITLFTQLVDAVVTILPVLIGTLLGVVLPQLLETVLGMIPDLLMTALDLFMMLIEAVVTVLPDLLDTLLTVVLPNLLTTILGMLPEILSAAITVFFALITGLLDVLPDLITTLLVDVLPELITTLIGMVPELIKTAFDLFVELGTGIVDAVPELVATIVTEVIPAIVGAIGGLGSELFTAGVNAMGDLLGGIKEKATEVVNWVKDNVVGAIKNLWPFSPAKEGPFSGRGSPLHAGQNIMNQLAEGIERGRREVLAAATTATGMLAQGLSGGVAVGAGGIGPINLNVAVTGDVSREKAVETGEAIAEGVLQRLSRAKVVQ